MKKQQRFLKNLKYTADAFVILMAYSLAAFFFNKLKIVHLSAVFYLVSCGLWFVFSFFSKLYSEKRFNKFSEEIVIIIYQGILFAVGLSSMLFFLNLNYKYSSFFIIVYVTFTTTLAIATKYIIRKKIHAALNRGQHYDNVILIGSNTAAQNFHETVSKYYYYGYKCIGFVDNLQNSFESCNYLGNINQLESILNNHPVDEVFIALSSEENRLIQQCISVCDKLQINVRMLPDLSEYTSSSIYINNIGLVPVVNVGHLPLDK